MQYTLSVETFFVSELFNPVLSEKGKYYYYLLEKKGLSHKQAVKKISNSSFCGTENCNSNSSDTKPPQIQMWFCGIKDKHATTKQWVCTKERIEDIDEEFFKFKYIGQSNEKIFVGKHKGNAFRVNVELNEDEEKSIKHFKAKNELCCNYFGEQRFNQKNLEIAELLTKEDYEEALKLFLTQVTVFDSDLSRAMKKSISENWGKWKELAESDIFRETKKRKVFDYLIENEGNYKGAFKASEPRSVALIVKTAQALRFNVELNKIALEKKPNNVQALIVGPNKTTSFMGPENQKGFLGQELNLFANMGMKRELSIEPTEFEQNFRKGILERRTFFAAQKFKAKKLQKGKYELNFELGKGQYATIFLIFLDKWMEFNKK
jgi:TruD family tRNA pseudouridine synthase